MSTVSCYTLTNPRSGQLGLKIYPFEENGPFDHLQRLNCYSIILLSEGSGRLSADFAEYAITAGDMLFFAPYQPFMVRTPVGIRGMVLHFHSDFFCIYEHQKEMAFNGLLFNNIYQTPVLPVSTGNMLGFLELIGQMKQEIHRAEPGQHEMLVLYLKVFLIRAARLKAGELPSSTLRSADRRKSELAQDLRNAIEANYRSKHSAGEYAALLHVSPKVLAKIAKTWFNKTITSLISERIIVEAKRELYMTSKTVKEIAYLLGFEDEFYFSRFFKNNADVSPQRYRETVGFARAEGAAASIFEQIDAAGAN